MMRHTVALTLLFSLFMAAAPATTRAAASAPLPTIFGKGAEVYVRPALVAPGTVVTVAGVGLLPGQRLVITANDPSAGGVGVYGLVARAVVGPRGGFMTTFKSAPYPSAYLYTPLVVAAESPDGKRFYGSGLLVLEQDKNAR